MADYREVDLDTLYSYLEDIEYEVTSSWEHDEIPYERYSDIIDLLFALFRIVDDA